jgi:hypothetical protein
MRSPFWGSLLVTLCLLLAVGQWMENHSLAWQYLFNLRLGAGAFGAAARDLPEETPARAAERAAREREILTAFRRSRRVSWGAATLAVLGAVMLSWRSRRAPGLRWLPVALLSVVSVAVFVLVLVA